MMPVILKRYFKDHGGASAVEFALLSPLLLLMLVGAVDFGFFVTEKMKIQNMAYTAADYVAQVQDDANVQVVAEETYGSDYDEVSLTSEFWCECSDGVAVQCPVSCGADDYQRRFVEINAVRDIQPLFPYPGVPDSARLQSTVRMRVD